MRLLTVVYNVSLAIALAFTVGVVFRLPLRPIWRRWRTHRMRIVCVNGYTVTVDHLPTNLAAGDTLMVRR